MDPHRRSHHRFLEKRQGQAGGVLGNVFAGTSTLNPVGLDITPSTTSQNTLSTSELAGISSGAQAPSPPVATSNTAQTHLASGSTGSTTPSVSTEKSTSSTSTTTPTPTPPPGAVSTSSTSDAVHTSSDGTNITYVTSTLPATSTTATPTTSFLQNPSLEGGVFALVGVVVLITLIVAVTWTVRRRRRNRLERDVAAAVTFDPSATDRYERQEDVVEKRRLSISSSGHSRGYHGYGMQPGYLPQQEYHGPVGYGPYPVPAYSAPTTPPNPAPYQTPSPTIPQPVAQGGANLTRKFSDRKPVPPLLPGPAHDPSNTRVSIPLQFYQQ